MEKNYEEIKEQIKDSFFKALSAKGYADAAMKVEAKLVAEAEGCGIMVDLGLMVVTYNEKCSIAVRWNESDGYYVVGDIIIDGKSTSDFYKDGVKDANEKWGNDGNELPEDWREWSVIYFLTGIYVMLDGDGEIGDFSIKKLGD